jgi:hypothetical protein
VQLTLEGVPYHKPKHHVGNEIIGADLGPSSIALVPREAEASLELFCEQLAPHAQKIRRLQRQMDRQRRAANPDNYDAQGRIKKYGKSVGLRAPGMFISLLKRTGAAHGRHPDRGSHTHHQTVAILPRLRPDCEKTTRAALAPVSLWYRTGATRPLLGISGRLSRSNHSGSLSCPVCHSLDRCGGAPTGRMGGCSTTCE